MNDFLKNLGITETGYYDDGSYIIEFDSENGFNRAYSKLDKSDDVVEDMDRTSLTLFGINITYNADDYVLFLKGDLENNDYKLIIKEKE